MNKVEKERLNSIFANIFKINDEDKIMQLSKEENIEWDSLAQASLIASVASEFDVDIEGSDFEIFISYTSIKEFLISKGVVEG